MTLTARRRPSISDACPAYTSDPLPCCLGFQYSFLCTKVSIAPFFLRSDTGVWIPTHTPVAVIVVAYLTLLHCFALATASQTNSVSTRILWLVLLLLSLHRGIWWIEAVTLPLLPTLLVVMIGWHGLEVEVELEVETPCVVLYHEC